MNNAGASRCHKFVGHPDDLWAQMLEVNLTGTYRVCKRNMRLLDEPIMATINGVVAGAGAAITLASDLRVMSEQARFAFLFTKVGRTGVDMGVACLLPRVVGVSQALENLILGDDVDAAPAEPIGLANRVVPPESVLSAAMEFAERLVQGPTFVLSMTKRMINNEWNVDLISASESEAPAQALQLMGEDHRRF